MTAKILVLNPDQSPSTAELEHQITQLAGRIHAATYQLLVLIAEFDRRDGWAGWGMRSCAHWLNWKCGIAIGAAREKVRVARALFELPEISDAFSKGEISYSKVRAMTRVATPDNEGYLLNIARHGTASHVEKLVRQYRTMQENAAIEQPNRSHAERSLKYYTDETGCLVINGRLPPEQGALVIKALEAAIDALPDMVDEEENVPAGTPDDTLAARRADALGALAESFIAHGLAELAGGDRHQIVVHMQADHCEFDDGPTIAAETARRLGCDSSTVRLIEDSEGNPLDIGRKTRSIPPAMRRALKARDDGCGFPGCTQRRFVDGHHIQHWAGGGETKMGNLVLLCRHHHRLVHEGGFGVRRDGGGGLQFWRPDGSVIVEAGDGIVIEHPRELTMLPRTRPVCWNGEPMDYDMALEALWQRDHVPHDPTTELEA